MVTWYGNLIEASLWGLISIALLTVAFPAIGGQRRLLLRVSVAFLVFGVTDLIEMQTGAWWRPPWLLVMKAACIAVFAQGIWQFTRQRKEPAAASVSDPD